MKLPKTVNDYRLEIHKYPHHYSVGYWLDGALLKFHGGVLLFKAEKMREAKKIMYEYLLKVVPYLLNN